MKSTVNPLASMLTWKSPCVIPCNEIVTRGMFPITDIKLYKTRKNKLV